MTFDKQESTYYQIFSIACPEEGCWQPHISAFLFRARAPYKAFPVVRYRCAHAVLG